MGGGATGPLLGGGGGGILLYFLYSSFYYDLSTTLLCVFVSYSILSSYFGYFEEVKVQESYCFVFSCFYNETDAYLCGIY